MEQLHDNFDTLVIVGSWNKYIFSEEWTYDETNHWHVATCGHEEVSDKAEHSFGEWEMITEATEANGGYTYGKQRQKRTWHVWYNSSLR